MQEILSEMHEKASQLMDVLPDEQALVFYTQKIVQLTTSIPPKDEERIMLADRLHFLLGMVFSFREVVLRYKNHQKLCARYAALYVTKQKIDREYLYFLPENEEEMLCLCKETFLNNRYNIIQ